MNYISPDDKILDQRESIEAKICDVIADAKTWDTILRAYDALIKVRRMSDNMAKEARHLAGEDDNCKPMTMGGDLP